MPLINPRTGKEFSKEMSESSLQVFTLIERRLPEQVEVIAQKLVDDSFMKETYQDGKSEHWKGRKNDSEGNEARDNRRALLVKSGGLIKSVEVERNGHDISISTDKPYAQVHNEGLRSGKGKGFDMPQRQFMPEPGERNEKLDKDIETWLDGEMDKILG
jgi:phage gpG-like protein